MCLIIDLLSFRCIPLAVKLVPGARNANLNMQSPYGQAASFLPSTAAHSQTSSLETPSRCGQGRQLARHVPRHFLLELSQKPEAPHSPHGARSKLSPHTRARPLWGYMHRHGRGEGYPGVTLTLRRGSNPPTKNNPQKTR